MLWLAKNVAQLFISNRWLYRETVKGLRFLEQIFVPYDKT